MSQKGVCCRAGFSAVPAGFLVLFLFFFYSVSGLVNKTSQDWLVEALSNFARSMNAIILINLAIRLIKVKNCLILITIARRLKISSISTPWSRKRPYLQLLELSPMPKYGNFKNRAVSRKSLPVISYVS